MHPILLAIRDTPERFLPEPSLKAFTHFRNGYLTRSSMEGGARDFGFDGHEFHAWLRARFQMPHGRAIAETTIVASFSFSEEAAFARYFDLLSEFLESSNKPHVSPKFQTENITFLELLRNIRKQPALYLGQPTFLGCCANLMGDERAWNDMNLPMDEGRSTFREFQRWIEAEKNGAGCSRPWFKVIQFWSGGFDCEGNNLGGFSLLCKWLDQFSKVIGKEGYFLA